MDHASQQTKIDQPVSNISLLPLFYDETCRGYSSQHKLVNNVHPGQTTIIAKDQSLYTIGENIQGFSVVLIVKTLLYVVMLGTLHTEMTLLTQIT